MRGRRSRRQLLALFGAGSVGLAGCLGESESTASDEPSETIETAEAVWATTTLEDVRTGETFTAAGFDRPTILEPFAVWCSTCQRQQQELATFHDAVGDEVVSINLGIDSNEDAETLATHADDHGFDWQYAVSPSEVTQSLVADFGQSIANPPQSPAILLCPEGEVTLLDDGVVTGADELEAAVETC